MQQESSRGPIYLLVFSLIGFILVLSFYLTQSITIEIQDETQEKEKEFYTQKEKYTEKKPIVQIKPPTPEELFEKGWKAYQEKKLEEVIQIWPKLFKTNPELFQKQAKETGEFFYRYKFYRNALAISQKAEENTFDLLFKAKCSLNVAKFSEAETFLQQHLANFPKDILAKKELYRLYKITQQLQTKKAQELIHSLTKEHKDEELIKEIVQFYLKQAAKHKDQKWAEKAKEIDPKNPRIYKILGSFSLGQKKYSDARTYFFQAKQLHPKKSKELESLLVRAYQEEYWATGDGKLVEEAQNKLPNSPEVRELELNHLLSLKDFEALFAKLEESKKRFPTTSQLEKFEKKARELYRNETIGTRFGFSKKLNIQLGLAQFPLLDQKFKPIDRIEEFEHILHQFSQCLLQQKPLKRFLTKDYNGTSLQPPLFPLPEKNKNQEKLIFSWPIQNCAIIEGIQAATLDWYTFVKPFINNGYLEFRVLELNGNATITAQLESSENQKIGYRGKIQLTWKKEDHYWKIAKLTLLQMETLSNSSSWFEEKTDAFPALLPFVDNENLNYHQIYDLVLGGIAVADYNGDGWQDIYFSNRGKNFLYKNNGKNSFEEVTKQAGVENDGDSRGATFIDYNQDGFLDLFVCNFSSKEFPKGNALYKNNGDGTFKEVTKTAGLSFHRTSINATWGDLDGDQDLDLFLSCYGNPNTNRYQFIGKRGGGERNQIYLNQGDGTFLEVGKKLGFTSKSWTYGAYIGDLNQDQLPDIYVINEYGPNEFYLNQGKLEFDELGLDYNLRNYLNSRSVVVKDINQDQLPDLFLVNLHSRYSSKITSLFPELKAKNLKLLQGSQGSTVLLNSGDDFFEEASKELNIFATASGYGCTIGELTNNSQLYCYVANGHYSAKTVIDFENYEWRRFILYQKALSDKFVSIHPSAYFHNKYRRLLNLAQKERAQQKLDLNQLQLSFLGHTRNRLFKITAKESSPEFSFLAGLDLKEDTRNVILADFDRDGDLDLIARTLQGIKYFTNKNPLQQKGFLISLQSSKPLYGAKVQITVANKTRTQWINSGEGFLSQFPTQLHFGLGSATKIEQLKVEWPDGKKQQWNQIENPGFITINYESEQIRNIPLEPNLPKMEEKQIEEKETKKEEDKKESWILKLFQKFYKPKKK